jgi:acyl-CoA hydrolase
MPSAPSPADAVLDHVGPGTDVVVPLANGEPVALLDALEGAAEAGRVEGVRVHQMHALHPRRYIDGAFGDRLRHVSYFLSSVTRPAFHAGTIDLVPAHFSEVPRSIRHTTTDPLVLAAASPMDRHGYFSLGTNADYVAGFLGQGRVFLEVNARMPRTFGRNQIHASQVLGWTEVDRPLIEVPAVAPSPIDETIAGFVAERIPEGATIQAGIGAVPSSLLRKLHGHRHLGVHTELLSDDFVDLVEAGAVDGSRKRRRPGRMVTTFCLGTSKLYGFIHDNPSLELLAVDWVNDPRVIAQEHLFMSINATTEVDFLGQCASETIGGRYWSGSGGQADFARGAMYAEGGKAFIVLHSTTSDGSISRIRPVLTPGSAVTTLKNTVDHVATEHGVAELRGRSIRERTAALIGIAHPRFREELTAEARAMGYLW